MPKAGAKRFTPLCELVELVFAPKRRRILARPFNAWYVLARISHKFFDAGRKPTSFPSEQVFDVPRDSDFGAVGKGFCENFV
jgi:hypothetical protein